MRAAALSALLVLAACGTAPPADWCPGFAATVDVSEFVSPRTGRLERDAAGRVIDPRTGRVALTGAEERCVRREAERAVERAGGG